MMDSLDKRSIDGLYFNQICMSFPKEYEVYDENNNVKQVAYIIEFKTSVRILCPNKDGEVIFDVSTKKDKELVEEIVKAIQNWCIKTGR